MWTRTAEWIKLRKTLEAMNKRREQEMREVANREALREKWQAANRNEEREITEAANVLIILSHVTPARVSGKGEPLGSTHEAAQTLVDMSKAPPAPTSQSNNQRTPSDAEIMEHFVATFRVMDQDPAPQDTTISKGNGTRPTTSNPTESPKESQRPTQTFPQTPSTPVSDRRRNPHRPARKASAYGLKASRRRDRRTVPYSRNQGHRGRVRKTQPKDPASTPRPPPTGPLAASRAEAAWKAAREAVRGLWE